jgi:hypothetical protein
MKRMGMNGDGDRQRSLGMEGRRQLEEKCG